jgi:hypothetical protein
MQRESDLDFSSGVTILDGLSFKSGIKRKKNFIYYYYYYYRCINCCGLFLSR